MHRARAAFHLGTLVALALAATPLGATSGYRYSLVGNPADVATPTTGLLVLQGGGTDVDRNFVAMGANSGGGDFVVLRASGGDAYNRYIFELCACDSVATIVFDNRTASFDRFVIDTVRGAEALFIAGGDQSRYVRFWKDTPIEDAIGHVAAKPAPVGGTSAGMAILGELVYSARGPSSLTSTEALGSPFHRDLTLDRDFLHLPHLAGTITDQHVLERDRIGRTIALLARLVQRGWTDRGRAIAADRETALHIDPRDGSAQVLATSDHPTPFVYFLETTGPPEKCRRGRPLTYRNVTVYRLGPGGRFDLRSWQGTGGIAYTMSVEGGVLSSSRGEVY